MLAERIIGIFIIVALVAPVSAIYINPDDLPTKEMAGRSTALDSGTILDSPTNLPLEYVIEENDNPESDDGDGLKWYDRIIRFIFNFDFKAGESPIDYKLGRDMIDVPWWIENSVDKVPILLIIDRSNVMYVYSMEIYDGRTNELLERFEDKEIIMDMPYFHLFEIDKNRFKREDNTILVYGRMKIGTLNGQSAIKYPIKTRTLKISLSDEHFPKFDNWYCGDTHLHTEYSNNIAEFGAPVEATKKALKAMGGDWMTITDHSFDLNEKKWKEMKEDCTKNSDGEFVCIQGEEVSCKREGGSLFFRKYSHVLVYDADRYIIGSELEDNLLSFKTHKCSELPAISKLFNGDNFVAHPFLKDPFRGEWEDFSIETDGYEIWNGNPDETFEKGYNKWIELSKNEKVVVESGSDAHGSFYSKLGRTLTCCNMDSLDKGNALNSLKGGNCYMTNNGAMVLEKSDSGVSVKYDLIESCKLTVYSRELGKEEKVIYEKNIRGSGSEEILASLPGKGYYRAECIKSYKRVYSNEVWIK